MMNGVGVGTVTHNGEDLDVVLKYRQFINTIKPDDILSHTFSVGPKTYRLGDFVEPIFKNAVASVKREAGLVTVSVGADFEVGINATETQAKFTAFANKYDFPPGINYKAGGENAENSDLVIAVLIAFFIAILAIFSLLTLLFNSFTQPVIVLYSVIMSLPYVMIGLLITGNQFSLPFGIGFIAFTGIAVNHGIILLDAININLRKGMQSFTALVEAGSSRLEPMLLTTLTTAL
jgi:multidrug efflux pump subunit AcrB